MKNPLIISSIILSMSIIEASTISKLTPQYSYENIFFNGAIGFTVRVEAKSGERCLMIEGLLQPTSSISNLDSFRSSGIPIPSEICKDQPNFKNFKSSHIKFLDDLEAEHSRPIFGHLDEPVVFGEDKAVKPFGVIDENAGLNEIFNFEEAEKKLKSD